MTTRSLPALTVIVALALAGCGASSPKPPTTAAFRSSLSALCAQGNTAFNKVSGVKAKSAVVAQYVTKFEALRPSPQLSSLYSRYLAVLRQESAALTAGNAAALTQLVRTKAHPLAEQLGATGCVS